MAGDILPGRLCAIVINSCDKYSDVWPIYCQLFEKFWPDCPYELIINTESKAFSYEGLNVKTMQLFAPGANVPWGKRLIETLKRIDAEYVLLTLEDYMFSGPVDRARFGQCLAWLESDNKVAAFRLPGIYYVTGKPWPPLFNDLEYSEKYTGFWRYKKTYKKYKTDCSPTIWRKKTLLKYLRPHESIWDWEQLGSRRCARYSEEYYVQGSDDPRILTTLASRCGGAIHEGLWVEENIKQVFEENGIKPDLSVRGMTPVFVRSQAGPGTRQLFMMLCRDVARKIKSLI